MGTSWGARGRWIGVALAAAGTGDLAGAQARLHTFFGETGTGTFGYAVATAGDLDRDGLDDVIASGVDYGSFVGYVRVYSGRDGSTLFRLDELYGGTGLGSDVAGGGDADGDGWPDLLIGSYWDSVTMHYAGAARVYSGRDGRLLRTFVGWEPFSWFGLAVDWVGDLDQDGHDDVIVGGYRASDHGLETGKAEVYSGRDGHVIHRFVGDQARDEFARSVSGIGDVNGDGVPDLLVGGFNSNVWQAPGYVRLYSGADGAVLRTHDGAQHPGFGVSLADLGDLDGDGAPDYAVGAHLERHPAAPQVPVGSVRVFSGASGALLHTFWGAPHSTLGYSVAGPGDFDGDGTPDIAAGAPSVSSSAGQGRYLVIWSGRTGAVLHEQQEDGGQFGNAVAGAGDVNGDGLGDLLVADYKDDQAGPSAGVVYVLAGGTPAPERYCLAAPNSTGEAASIGFVGGPGLTVDDLTLRAAGAVPGEAALFFFGDERAQLPFGAGWRCVGGALHRVGPPGLVDPAGAIERALDLAALEGDPLAPGDTWHFQLWYRDPADSAGFNLSDGLSVSFCR